MSEKKKKLAWVDRTLCAACGCCLKVCRRKALTIYKGLYARPDEARCTGCGLCAAKCPKKAITMRDRRAPRNKMDKVKKAPVAPKPAAPVQK